MTQNGILVMGIAALVILFWTEGKVTLLVQRRLHLEGLQMVILPMKV